MPLPTAGPPKQRRGAPIPLPSDQVLPTGKLRARERQMFDSVALTRPGFWCRADLLLMTSYAKAAVRLENAEAAGEIADIERTLRTVLTLARSLRLSPQARDSEDAGVGHAQEASGLIATYRSAPGIFPWSAAN